MTGKYFAVARFIKCLIYDAKSGKEIAEVKSPVANEVYPVVPVAFYNNEYVYHFILTFVLVLKRGGSVTHCSTFIV